MPAHVVTSPCIVEDARGNHQDRQYLLEEDYVV